MGPTLAGFCAKCFQGTLRGDIIPTGTEETLHGREVYVARPDDGAKPLGLIVILTDVFGWATPNIRGLADSFARNGPFVVYVPDLILGTPCNPDYFGWMDGIKSTSPDWYTTLVMKPWWAWKIVSNFVPFGVRCRDSVMRPRVDSFFRSIRQSPPPAELLGHPNTLPPQIGVIGYCWGGLYAVKLAQDTASTRVMPHSGHKLSPLVDCAFTAHPSLLRIPSDIKDLPIPISIASGDGDEWMGAERTKEMARILEKQGKHEVVIYPGAMHGFAVRGDPKDPKQTEYALQAEEQAISWFKKHFEGWKG